MIEKNQSHFTLLTTILIILQLLLIQIVNQTTCLSLWETKNIRILHTDKAITSLSHGKIREINYLHLYSTCINEISLIVVLQPEEHHTYRAPTIKIVKFFICPLCDFVCKCNIQIITSKFYNNLDIYEGKKKKKNRIIQKAKIMSSKIYKSRLIKNLNIQEPG